MRAHCSGSSATPELYSGSSVARELADGRDAALGGAPSAHAENVVRSRTTPKTDDAVLAYSRA